MPTTIETLYRLLSERILILDGAMGTEIQSYNLTEDDYRGTRFPRAATADADTPAPDAPAPDGPHGHGCRHTNGHGGEATEKKAAGHGAGPATPGDLKGNNELLSLTRPEIIREIHRKYLDAGADIIETNTFSANRVSQADYELQHLCYELNVASAQLARQAVEQFAAANPNAGPRFVAGALGPTTRTASLSPDVNDPGYRAVTFQDLVEAYSEQTEGLLDGGSDVLLIETVFDTLNCKAALFAIQQVCEQRGILVPVMISVTITDASGRTLSGQTLEAFYNSVCHAPNLLSLGINCALGPKEMRPYIAELARISQFYVSCYPNAGLPNAFGGYDETPDSMGQDMLDFAQNGFVNILGGCCGTRPAHIARFAELVKGVKPRPLPITTIAV